MPKDVTMADAVEQIADGHGSAAAGLVVGLMEHSRRQNDWVLDQLLAGEKASAERWKARALAAERRLRLAEINLNELVFGDQPVYTES